METINEIEEYLIRGTVYIFDVSGMTMAFVRIAPIEQTMKVIKNSLKCLSGRHKGVHFVNVAPTLSYAFNFVINQATDKLRERIRFYSSVDQLDFIDKEDLPKEYGGSIPMEEMSSKKWNVKNLR